MLVDEMPVGDYKFTGSDRKMLDCVMPVRECVVGKPLLLGTETSTRAPVERIVSFADMYTVKIENGPVFKFIPLDVWRATATDRALAAGADMVRHF